MYFPYAEMRLVCGHIVSKCIEILQIFVRMEENPYTFHFAYFCMWTLSLEYQKHSHVYLNRMLRIPADVKISEKYQTVSNRMLTECKEYQNIHVFAFLQHLQAYLGIPQIFLSAFPAEFLKFPRVCPCVSNNWVCPCVKSRFYI